MRGRLLALATAFLLCAPAAAPAQIAYVANSGSGTVSVLDAATGRPAAPPIAVGGTPTEVAMVPDASHAYVTDASADRVVAISLASSSVVASIPVGDEPAGIAISPDGTRAYVANAGEDTVSTIDIAANGTIGPPIAVGDRPGGVAVVPGRDQILVAQRSGGIALVDLPSRAVIFTIPDSLGPLGLTVTPDGTRAYVTNADSTSVSLFELTFGNPLGVPIPIGANPSGIALTPNGRAYAASSSEGTVSALDAVTHARVGPPIPGFSGPAGLATTADGSTVLVANSTAASVSVLDTGSASVIDSAPVGAAPKGIAITPDQAPRSSFTATRAKRQGLLLSFDASASTDSDSQIATYAWDFGDGRSEVNPFPAVEHTYEKPGEHRVTLTVTDREGCSRALVFTGQTVTCNGSPAASSSLTVRATDTVKPALRLSGPRRQRLGPTVFAVARCPRERCRLKLGGALMVSTSSPGRRGSGKKRSFALALERTSIPAGGKAALRLALSAKGREAARSALRLSGQVQVRLRAVATDAAGNKSVRQRGLQLIEPRSKRNPR